MKHGKEAANARKGNRTFIVRLCVTAVSRLTSSETIPAFPILAPAPLAGSRATVVGCHKSGKRPEGTKEPGVRRKVAAVRPQFLLRLTKVIVLPTKVFFRAHPTTLWCCCYGTRIRITVGYLVRSGYVPRSRQFLFSRSGLRRFHANQPDSQSGQANRQNGRPAKGSDD